MSSRMGELGDSIEKGREALRRASEHARDWPPLERESLQRRDQPYGDAPALAPFDLHPFFRGLLEALPQPGANWSREEREQWLETARNIFGLLYKDAEQSSEQAAADTTPLRLIEPEPQAPPEPPAFEQRSA